MRGGLELLVAAVLLLLVAPSSGSSDDSGEGGVASLLSETELEQVLADMDAAPTEKTGPVVVLSKQMSGRWASTWTQACSRKVINGHVYFQNASIQFFAYRRDDGTKVDEDISGEGETMPYLPFLKRIPRPFTNGAVELNYGYQLCTSLKHTIPTPTDAVRSFGAETEVRVMRGFVYEDTYDADGRSMVHNALDRCVDGLNRNFNFFVTTVGSPFDDDSSRDGEMTQHLRYVKWQFRLPGLTKCDPTLIPVDPAATLSGGSDIGAADAAFDSMVWVRTNQPPPGSFFEEHYHMIMFAVLFIVFRMYTSYRFHSQKFTIQKNFLQDVADEEAKMKQSMLEKQNQRKTK